MGIEKKDGMEKQRRNGKWEWQKQKTIVSIWQRGCPRAKWVKRDWKEEKREWKWKTRKHDKSHVYLMMTWMTKWFQWQNGKMSLMIECDEKREVGGWTGWWMSIYIHIDSP